MGKVFVHGLGQIPESWDAVLSFINGDGEIRKTLKSLLWNSVIISK